ncbi:MAG: ABC transporter substrate-binding protein [Dysgonamonadaceae bacterium]|nr:ABC transporter substrate-binding protein [Dysgonamonadaceae bacterium]MDD3355485.1 ABC transporter substrate-binding protein [Dysgonamonadaceae bacterium]MDD3727596.1 ABC transporter substrate-binding protein [Dysgonamonadaceae bacterium]MDD4246626.1 ABC transporter substrate-binding protein [Dysgonamonadaceae bacterium]MDD4605885.1 ABC transporter substrate-binding protein [Dysgonamonadaceae bacterium]
MRIIFPLLLAVNLIFFGCQHQPKQTDTITIATLKGPSAMGMIKFIDSLSTVSDSHIKVEILNEPIQIRKMVIDGTADFAILPTTMAAILYNKGIDYRLLAIPVWGTLYLFGNDTSITQWEHLRGKRINVMAKGMTPDVLFRYLLMQHGLDPDNDVTLDYSFPTHIDLANAVAAEQAKLGVISEPLVSLVMQRNTKVKSIFDLNAEWNKVLDIPIAQTAFIVKGELTKNSKELVEKVMQSYHYSTQWVNQYPDSAANLIVKYNILPNNQVAANAIPRSNLHFVRANTISAQIDSYLNIFYQMSPDIIGGKLPDENFYQ